MREMAAMGEVHRQDRVAVLKGREVDGHVRLGAGVRLDVGPLAAEEFEQALDGDLLGDVDELAAAVVAALPGRPSAYLLVRTEPWAAMTAADV